MRSRLASSDRSRRSLRSIPDENIAPSPRRTSTRTSGSAAASSIAPPSSEISSPLSALRFSGRFRTRWRTAPRSSVWTSAMALRLLAIRRPPERRGTHRVEGLCPCDAFLNASEPPRDGRGDHRCRGRHRRGPARRRRRRRSRRCSSERSAPGSRLVRCTRATRWCGAGCAPSCAASASQYIHPSHVRPGTGARARAGRRSAAPSRQVAGAGQAARPRARGALGRRGQLRGGRPARELGAGRLRSRRRGHGHGHRRRPAGGADGQRPDRQGRLLGPQDSREDHPHPGAGARAPGSDDLPGGLGGRAHHRPGADVPRPPRRRAHLPHRGEAVGRRAADLRPVRPQRRRRRLHPGVLRRRDHARRQRLDVPGVAADGGDGDRREA